MTNDEPGLIIYRHGPNGTIILTGYALSELLRRQRWAVLHNNEWWIPADRWPAIEAIAARLDVTLVNADPADTPTPPHLPRLTPLTPEQRKAAHAAYLETIARLRQTDTG